MKASFILRKKPLSDGRYPVVLSTSKYGVKKIISLKMYCQKEDWDEDSQSFVKKHKDPNLILDRFKKKANDILLEARLSGDDLSLLEFEEKFRGIKRRSYSNAIDFFKELEAELIEARKLKNAKTYKGTIKKLVDFYGKEIPFSRLNVEFMQKWEAYLRGTGHHDGGLSVRFRTLRAMINKAIERDHMDRSAYPFERFKVSKFKSNPQKRALNLEEFKRIKQVDLSDHPQLQIAHDLFMFSFYCAGINFIDMMKLKWDDIHEGRLRYIRSKTGRAFDLELSSSALKIIDKYKDFPGHSIFYVFPIILEDGLSEKQIFHRRDNYLKRYNQKLKEIAKLAGVKPNISSYVSRHSMASLLKQSGTSIELISEIMGHSSVKVTMEYLKAFDLEVLDQEIQKLGRL